MQKRYDPMRFLRDLLCGILVGGGAILPGVSGGVLAVIFGIYRPFMEMLTFPREAIPQYWRMIPGLGIGCVVGFLAFAKGIALLFATSASVAVWLFIGLICGTLPQLFREAGKEGRTRGSWISFGLCFIVVFAALAFTGHGISYQATPGVAWYLFSGALFGIGVIVPGMSSSAVLMALGLYEPVLNAMAELNVPVLIPIGVGVVLSVLLLARTVSWFLRRHNSLAMHGIMGIVIASTLVILPLTYHSVWEIVLSVFCCVVGFLLARLMDRLDARLERDA